MTAPQRRATALALIGAWTVAAPFVARATGLGVDVATKVEIVDHVVPGLLIALSGAWLALRPGRVSLPVAGGLCFLAGFWVLATHVPLVADAARGQERWGAALVHVSAALPIVVLSLWLVLEPESPSAEPPRRRR